MTARRKAQPRQRRRTAKKDEPNGMRAVSYKKVKRETVEWFWDGLIPYGMLTLVVGDPGLGKSLLTVHLAAKASREGVSSILLSAEDHKGATIRPRLEAAKADLRLVHHIEVRRDGVEDGVFLPDDGDRLDRIIGKTKARLVVVDPLTAHLPQNINSWHDQSVPACPRTASSFSRETWLRGSGCGAPQQGSRPRPALPHRREHRASSRCPLRLATGTRSRRFRGRAGQSESAGPHQVQRRASIGEPRLRDQNQDVAR